MVQELAQEQVSGQEWVLELAQALEWELVMDAVLVWLMLQLWDLVLVISWS